MAGATRHLENINLFLAPHPRSDFWKLSAFFARTRLQIVTDDFAGFRPRLIFSNSQSGLYTGVVDPSNPGARPARTDANERPLYWLNAQQQEPANGNWQQEFARLLTSDRQFSLAAVNYIWSYFFGSGIVDPPDGWDLRRTDPSNPPPSETELPFHFTRGEKDIILDGVPPESGCVGRVCLLSPS
jgi:hypothetical protein